MGHDVPERQGTPPAEPFMTMLASSPSEPAEATRRGRLPFVRWSLPMFHHIVAAVDVCAVVLAAWLAGLAVIRDQRLPFIADEAFAVAVATFLTHKLLCRLNTYELQRYQQPIRSLLHIVLAVCVGVFVGVAATSLLVPDQQDRPTWMLLWTGIGIGLLTLNRQVAWLVARHGLRTGTLRRKVAFIGATALAESLVDQMSHPNLPQPYQIIGVFDDRALGRRPAVVGNYRVGGTVDALCAYAETNPVDLIVIALPWNRAMQIWAMIQRLQWISADVMIPLEDGGFNPRVARVSAIAGQPALQVMQQPLQGAGVLIKLIEDYAVAGLALLLAAPVLAVAALAVKLDSPGPVIFRQPRVGANRKLFDVLKLRTMYVDNSDKGVVGVARDNPRITRVGGLLRRLSIDELPQLWNVIRGEMSVVGPRPHVPGMLVGAQEYTLAVQDYAARHRIKPGITGWAQVNGMRGGIHSVEKARRGVDLDMHYIENWSVWFDLRIMVRTLVTGIAGRNVF